MSRRADFDEPTMNKRQALQSIFCGALVTTPLLVLTGCSEKAVSFVSIDITGAEYAPLQAG